MRRGWQRVAHGLTVVSQTEFELQALLELPTCARITKGLNENVRTALLEGFQRGEHVNSAKPVPQGGIKCDGMNIDGGAQTVRARDETDVLDGLIVPLRPVRIHPVRLPERNDARDFQDGPRGVRADVLSALRKLDAKVAHRR